MLSKNASQVFRIAKKSESHKVAYQDLKTKLGWDFDQVKSACNQLVEENLAEEKQCFTLPGKPSIPWGIVLKEKGRNRWKYIIEDFCKFILKSIIVPVVVSVLTTLVTLLLTGFFES